MKLSLHRTFMGRYRRRNVFWSCLPKRCPVAGDPWRRVESRPAYALPEGYAPAKVAERLNEVALRLSLCAATATAKWIKCFCIPDNRAVATGITGKTTSVFDAGHLFGPENLPALNQNDVLVSVIPICQWQNSGGRFSTLTPLGEYSERRSSGELWHAG